MTTTMRCVAFAALLFISACGSGSTGEQCGGRQCSSSQKCDTANQVCVIDDSPRIVDCGEAKCQTTQRCDEATRVCVVDAAPVVAITAPAAATVITGTQVTVTGNAIDDSGAPPTLELSLDDGASWKGVMRATDGSFSVSAIVPTLDGKPLSISVRARDGKKQETVAKVAVRVDNVDPTCTITSPENGSFFTAVGNLAVETTWADGSGAPAKAELSQDGSTFKPVPVTNGLGMGQVTFGAENNREVTITFRAEDAAGHACVATTRVIVDNVPPVFVSPVDAGAIFGAAFFADGGTLTGAATDGQNPVTVSLQVGADKSSVTTTDGGWTLAMPMRANADFMLEPFKLKAKDPAGNTVGIETDVYFDVKAPALEITAPTMNQKFNAAAFSSSDKVTVSWTLTDGDPQVKVFAVSGSQRTLVTGTSLQVQTNASDNPASYQVSLVAVDRAGNETARSVSFSVDRVVPTIVARTPTANTRNVMSSSSATISFSEPMVGTSGLAVSAVTTVPPATPAPSGNWSAGNTLFTVTGFLGDTVYSAAVPALADAYGNPVVVPAAQKFHTAPLVVQNEQVLATNVESFQVAADADGALSIWVRSTGASKTHGWIAVDPLDGVAKDLFTHSAGTNVKRPMVQALRTVQSDLASRRVISFYSERVSTLTTQTARYRISGAAQPEQMDTSMGGFIAGPAHPFEGMPAAETGQILAGNYVRAGRPNVPMQIATPDHIGEYAGHFELISTVGGTFRRQSFFCSTTATGPSCSAQPVSETTNTFAPYSFATSNNCSLHTYDGPVQRQQVIEQTGGCGLVICPVTAPVVEAAMPRTELRVAADPSTANRFVGAWRTATGLKLGTRALSTSCAGAWADLPGELTASGVLDFAPVMIGTRPAILYVTSTNQLKAYVP